ncbi:Protein CASC5, related [Eimeria acervulina]|uniref:Protein CASC5, related n=1 Tax=Eimeria acervulina TaxID=5801 RepID=U6GBJ2_EIMAC|nr:Protein CASC5, related [Eimeria acervulina]CDI76698.1 Protein CASC5, related [Eimeria acervulina]
MATLGESKSARKHVGTAPIAASDLNEGCDEHFIAIKKDLALVKGLSEAKVEKIVEAAMKLELCNSFISGGELITRRAKVVCYIDTEATFRPEKICLIAERFGLDGAGVLDNIMYARAYTTEHMHQLFTVAAAKVRLDSRF